MKNLLITLSIFFATFCLFSCKSTKIVDTNTATKSSVSKEDLMYAEMGKDMCKCMEPMLKISEEIKGKTPDEVAELMEGMQAESNNMEACVKGLQLKYPSIDFKASSNTKAENALLENCPAYKKAMESKG